MAHALSFLLCAFFCLAAAADVGIGQVRKVSLIHIGPSGRLNEAAFGHAALRLSPGDTPGLTDVVAEFVADVPSDEGGAMRYLRGTGWYRPYPVKVGLYGFHDFRLRKTLHEDRPVTAFELNLTPAQVRVVVDFIQGRGQLSSEEYRFFSNNCSFFAALAVERAIGRPIPNKNVPNEVGPSMRRMGLVSEETVYPNGSSERFRRAEDFLRGDGARLLPEAQARRFAEQLGEGDLQVRLSSYLKLVGLLAGNAPDDAKRDVRRLWRLLLEQEPDAVKHVLRHMAQEPEQKRVLVMQGSLPVRGGPRDTSVPTGSRTASLGVERGRVVVKLRGRSYPVTGLAYEEATRAVKYGSTVVGRWVEAKQGAWLLSQRLDVGIDAAGNSFTGYVYVDLSNEMVKPLPSMAELRSQMPALNNAQDFQGEGGSCHALAQLMRALLERAVFLPNLPALTASQKLTVLRELTRGAVVAVPGHANAGEFTASIDKETFKALVREYQAVLEAGGTFSRALGNLTTRELIDSQAKLSHMQGFLSEGVPVPMIIGLSERGRLRLASDAAHVVLVFGLEPLPLPEGGFRLAVYDPNTGVHTLLRMGRDFKLSAPFYDPQWDYIPVMDAMGEEASSAAHAFRLHGFKTDVLEQHLRAGGSPVIPAHEAHRFLN